MKLAHAPIFAAALLLVGGPAFSQNPPGSHAGTFPTHALEPALDAVARELIALGVAAQFPCAYCIDYRSKQARALGATEAEVREAVATAAHVRHWSTVLNGMAYDPERFKGEVDRMFETR